MSDTTATELLAALVQQKLDLLEQLRELGRRQCQLVQEGDTTRLLTLLSAKQKLVVDLQRMERQIDPYRDEDPQQRRWKSPEVRQRCRQAVERSETLLGEIVLLEKQCAAQLEQRQNATAQNLNDLQHAAAARTAYAQDDPNPQRHLDLRSG